VPKATIFLLCAIGLWLVPMGQGHALEPLSRAEMDTVRGRSGVSLALGEVSMYRHRASWEYQDTAQGNSLLLRNLVYSDGEGGPFRIHTPEGMYLDIFESSDQEGVFSLLAPAWEQNIFLDAEELVFCGQDLGSLKAHLLRPEEFSLYLSPLDTGVGLQLDTRARLDSAEWVYNQNGDSVSLVDLCLAESFDGQPKNPGEWQPQGRFSLGGGLAPDSNGGSVAEMHVLQDDQGRGLIRLNMPMRGSVRLKELKVGGRDMGPVVVDGLRVHRLEVDLVPFTE